ncbi:hypothetical protein [Bacillus sp. AFS001701]|nr:hypothetical protein [Bacillus sp. AFS001701]
MDNFSLLITLLQLIFLIVVVYIVIMIIKKVRLFVANNLFISK